MYKHKLKMSNPTILSISPSEERAIITSARTTIEICVRKYADKTGFRHAFTKEDIDDIVSDTTYRACRSFSTFNKSKAKLSTWVNRIAVNTFRDAIVYKMKRRYINCEFIGENQESGKEFSLGEVHRDLQDSSCESWASLSEDSADRHLLFDEFEAGLSDLGSGKSKRNRQFLKWLEDGYSTNEMAAMDGCSPNAASKRLWGIRNVIREKGAGIFPEEFGTFGLKSAC